MKNLEDLDNEMSEMDLEPASKKVTDYLNILRSNILPIILIFSISLIVTLVYLKNYPTVYRSVTTLKIDKPQSILEPQNIFMLESMSERILLNQVEVMRSYYIRDIVAKALLDSLKTLGNTSNFSIVVKKLNERETVPLTQTELRRKLAGVVRIDLKKNVDAVTLTADGLDFHEVQMITNLYALVFMDYSRELNRQDITNVKKFLEEERSKKQNELNNAESALESYQQKVGYVVLDDQAKTLVENLSKYEADKNGVDVDMKANDKSLETLRKQYSDLDSDFYDYIRGQINQPYIAELQRQIAELEVNRDLELANVTDPKVRDKTTSSYASKLAGLKSILDEKTEILKSGILSATPEDKKVLNQKVFDATLYSTNLKSKSNTLGAIVKKYEADFAKLPSESIELAKLERTRKTNEKLYITLEEKYQEATINERTRFGSASLLEPGFDTTTPVAPNKNLILLTGIIIGLTLGLVFAFVRNFLDKSIKNPEQLENSGVSVLSWIPSFRELLEVNSPETDFVVELKPTSTVSESFKALRTRIQYAKLEEEPTKSILITSTIPTEGKTIVSVNLAGSFAQAGKKTLLLDCDLRKPRIHNIFSFERYPGLSDYLFSNVTFEEIIRKTKLEFLDVMTSGTIPPNPSELLGSLQMKNFIDKLKTHYDIIIIDSPPFISVTDSEILFNITDGTILVARSNMTPADAFLKTYKRLYNLNPHNLLGCVLNNFAFKSTYGYYYNYYYYYSKPDDRTKRLKKNKK